MTKIHACILLALASCTTEQTDLPDDVSELELELSSGEVSMFASYRISVSEATDGRPVIERELSAEPDTPSRFVAALPAERPLLIDVVALDANQAQVGAGAAIVELEGGARSAVAIDVIAFGPGAASGVIDVTLAGRQLPTQDYLTVDPVSNHAGKTQMLDGKSTSVDGIIMPIDVRALSIDTAVAPMFTPAGDGGVTATWEWPVPKLFPATQSARFAFLDKRGRGWIAHATATFDSIVMPAEVSFSWAGAVLHSGTLGSQGLWHLGVESDGGKASSTIVHVHADANNDGAFGPGERLVQPVGGRLIVWTAPAPDGITAPPNLAGAILDHDGDGKLDTMIALGKDGTLAATTWPMK